MAYKKMATTKGSVLVKVGLPNAQPVDSRDQEMSSNPETKVRLRTSASFIGERFTVFYEFTPRKQFGASIERLSRIHLRLVLDIVFQPPTSE